MITLVYIRFITVSHNPLRAGGVPVCCLHLRYAVLLLTVVILYFIKCLRNKFAKII